MSSSEHDTFSADELAIEMVSRALDGALGDRQSGDDLGDYVATAIDSPEHAYLIATSLLIIARDMAMFSGMRSAGLNNLDALREAGHDAAVAAGFGFWQDFLTVTRQS